jgi:phosphopantetheine--protein transferase-like protein
MVERSSGLDRRHRVAWSPPESGLVSRAQVSLEADANLSRLADRYLSSDERPAFEDRSARGQVPWLLGRVAAKDAVRRHLVARGFAEFDPTRIVVVNDERGCPAVQVRGARLSARGLRVSIAHKPTVAVAVAATPPRPAADAGIGIDVEALEPRSAAFERTAFTPAERDLVSAAGPARHAALTRMWAAKEATAKATGLGLGGRPKTFEIEAVCDGHLRCRGRWIATEALTTAAGDFVVAWTDSY